MSGGEGIPGRVPGYGVASRTRFTAWVHHGTNGPGGMSDKYA